MPLTGPERVDWEALAWVHHGGVAHYRETYLEGGRALPRWLLPELLFDGLLADGLLALTQPDNNGLARVSLTERGRDRYAQLCQQTGRLTDASSPDRRRPAKSPHITPWRGLW